MSPVLPGLLLLALLALPRTLAPVHQAAVPDVNAIGPQVGQTVPDFNLPDQNGASHTLKSVLGQNGAMLVFFRSADW